MIGFFEILETIINNFEFEVLEIKKKIILILKTFQIKQFQF